MSCYYKRLPPTPFTPYPLNSCQTSVVTSVIRVAFQGVSPVNNVAADYTHLYDGPAVMQGGVYVYAQLNANGTSVPLAYMLSSGNEVRGVCRDCGCGVFALRSPLQFAYVHPAVAQDKAGHERMHAKNVKCGILMDILRCDGEKGMAKLKNMRGTVNLLSMSFHHNSLMP